MLRHVITLLAAFASAQAALLAEPLPTVFTYQGQLKSDGMAQNSTADLEFSLWDSADTDCSTPDGSQIGATQTIANVTLTDGLFTVELNSGGEFGADPFDGSARWLQIAVRSPAGSGAFTTLCPRQPLAAAPYALFSTKPWQTDGTDISYAAGNVGIGTASPAAMLDVTGDIQGGGRVALGNDAILGQDGPYAHIFDISHSITDFSADADWEALDSTITFDPTVDLTGANSRYLYSHDFQSRIPGGNARNFEFLAGPFHGASHEGSGTVNLLGGSLLGAQTHSGTTLWQIGAKAVSLGGFGPAVINKNVALEVTAGHWGVGGSITDNFGIYIDAPYADSPLSNHYGLYLEDQDFGSLDSYAIYSAGGTCYFAGDVGIGTANPAAKLDVNGTSRMTGFEMPTGAAAGKVLQSDSNGVGTWQNDRLTLPFAGSASSTAAVLDITNTNASGTSYAIRALSNGYGIYGETTGSAAGVRGLAADTGGTNYGVLGTSASDTGRGVFGHASSTTGNNYGVRGESDSTDGVGVYGFADASSGDTYGVFGEADSTGGIGVYGIADASSGGTSGVFGRSNSATGVGVYGENPDNVGVWGRATATSGVNYGVYGQTSSPDGFGVYCIGRMHVNGTLSKNAGSFKIDHPLDPANKYLSHSFVESPDMMNIYNGNAITDDTGYATIELPEWFDALNRDFRYQLTVIGQFAEAIVAEEIVNSSFVIRTDLPRVKVSWQVTGVRHDAYAQAYRIPVEEDKPAEERGRFQHPELYDLPPELGIDFAPPRDAPSTRDPESLDLSVHSPEI